MKIFRLLLYFGVLLLIAACPTDTGLKEYEYSYFLINISNKSLHYESYRGDSLLFDTTLLPKDTLFLYSCKEAPLLGRVCDDQTYFELGRDKDKIIIKNESQIVSFIHNRTNTCGYDNSVFEKRHSSGNHNYYYWTIDSAYIADKSCNMSWEDFEREFLKNE